MSWHAQKPADRSGAEKNTEMQNEQFYLGTGLGLGLYFRVRISDSFWFLSPGEAINTQGRKRESHGESKGESNWFSFEILAGMMANKRVVHLALFRFP